jgi:HEAT repeat protein
MAGRTQGEPATNGPAEARHALLRLRSWHVIDRARAVRRLAELGVGWRVLLPMLSDPSPAVRVATVEALSIAGEAVPEVVDGLLCAIDDADDRVCAAAIRSLGDLKAEKACDQVLACLGDWQDACRKSPRHPPRPCIAKAALDYLVRLGTPAVAEHLLPLLEVHWPHLRVAAARAIGQLHYAAAVPHLVRRLESIMGLAVRREADDNEARAYIHVLSRLGDAARDASTALIRTARNAVGLRSTAVEALAAICPREAAPQLVPLLADPGERLRDRLLRLMVKAGHRDASPAVRALLLDRQHGVRAAALRTLAKIGATDAVDQIRDMIDTEGNPFVRAEAVTALMALLGPNAALTDLRRLLDDPNPLVRRAAVDGMSRLRPTLEETLIPIRRLATDECPAVAEAARSALASLGHASTAAK